MGIRELIEQGAPHYAVRFCKFLQVFGKRFRVAGNVQDAAVAFHQFERGRVKAGARRVDEYGAELETAQVDGELSESYELVEGDILTVRSNGNKRLIGRCALVEKISHKTSFSGFIIRIRLKTSITTFSIKAKSLGGASHSYILSPMVNWD